MEAAETISITLPPELLAKAQTLAQSEHRTISDLFGEALRRYMSADPDWDALFARTRALGISLGIESEADVERLSDEFRLEKQNAVAR